jgi:hypothetical protein
MIAKRGIDSAFLIFLFCLISFPCSADEILFQNQKSPQAGVVVGEDTQSVTIRFPKTAIKSITRGMDKTSHALSDKVIWEEGKEYLILKIPRSSIQVLSHETLAGPPAATQKPASSGLLQNQAEPLRPKGPPEKNGVSGTAKVTGSPTNMNAQQELLKEEMGSVQGRIMWRGKPLQDRKVKIVLERYTGFSLAALKKWFTGDKEESSRNGIVLATRTDSQGRYVFHQVPPGFYRLYWMPDADTGWIRRLREKPDIEVASGNLTVENVPEKTKK